MKDSTITSNVELSLNQGRSPEIFTFSFLDTVSSLLRSFTCFAELHGTLTGFYIMNIKHNRYEKLTAARNSKKFHATH